MAWGWGAGQGKYEEAEAVKKMADKMENAEMEATQGTYEAEVMLKEQQVRAKQQQEMEALLHRAARGRDELRQTRTLDLERRQQRFKNVMVRTLIRPAPPLPPILRTTCTVGCG